MNKAALLAAIPLLLGAACQRPAPPVVSEATGFFVSSDLILTNRHFVQKGRCRNFRAASSDGALREADLELAGFPADREIDLALLRLKQGSYPAAPIILHSFDGAPRTIEEPNAAILTYPSWDMGNPDVAAAVLRSNAVVLLGYRDLAAEVQIVIDEYGTITRLPAGAMPAPNADRIKLYPGRAKLIVLYSTALRPGASGSPIVDGKGRLIGVIKGEVDSFLARDVGVAVDAADIAAFLDLRGIAWNRPDASAPASDLSRNVVRLFCFGS